MSGLEDIGVRPEGVAEPDSWALVRPVLHEVHHALRRFVQSGESTVIDLTSLPFGPGAEEQLLEYLGEGEVRATLDTLGRSRLWETRFPGVWIVDHYNPEQVRIALQIEVTEVPTMLRSQREDVVDGLDRLADQLARYKDQ